MTLSEIFEKYKEVFILCLEKAGTETSNPAYLNCENILLKNEEEIQSIIKQDAPFEVFITVLITLVLAEIHGISKLEQNDLEKNKEFLEDLFQRYLWKSTRTFSTRNGLAIIDHLHTSFYIYNNYDKKF